MPKDAAKKGILFLCTGNSCRSQMAEGFARKLLSEQVNIYSAGIEAHGLNNRAVRVMGEIGINISEQKSKTIDDIPKNEIDIVITLCGHANETCPIFSGKVKRLHWEIEDPVKAQGTEEEILKVFRKIRDQIKDLIEKKLKQLNVRPQLWRKTRPQGGNRRR